MDMDIMIEQINERINEYAHDTACINIMGGKMGFCLHFFQMGNSMENTHYHLWAEKLLDEIYTQLYQDISIKAVPDLIQACIGIDYLIKHRFINGNVNYILSDVDEMLFRRMTTTINPLILNSEVPDYIFILYYLFIRIEQLKPNSDNRFFMEELAIKAVNDLYSSIDNNFYNDPMFFTLEYKLPSFLYVLSKIYSLNFYNYRIGELIREISHLIQSRIPGLHANRLYLLWGLVHLKQSTNYSFWDEQINIIYHSINLKKIIDQELRNKQVFINDGVAGVCLLLTTLEKTDYRIPYNHEVMLKRIYSSDIWEQSPQQKLTFANGLCGLLWVINIINESKLT